MQRHAFKAFRARDGAPASVREIHVRKHYPRKLSDAVVPRTELVLGGALSDVRPPRSVDAERDAASRACYTMHPADKDWASVLASTLGALKEPDDCIRLVFLDGEGARGLAEGREPWSSDAWLTHSVALFGDERPVCVAGKRLPIVAWMQCQGFVEACASFRADADAEDLERFREASADLPWVSTLPAMGARDKIETVPHAIFLDFLNFVLDDNEGDAALAGRFEDVRLFATVRLCGGCYEGGLREDVVGQKATVFEF